MSELADDYSAMRSSRRQVNNGRARLRPPQKSNATIDATGYESSDRPEDRGRNYAQTAHEIDQDPAASFDDLYHPMQITAAREDTANNLLHDMLENAARLNRRGRLR